MAQTQMDSYDKDKLIGYLLFSLKDLTADCVNQKDVLKKPKLAVLFSAEAAIRMAENPMDYPALAAPVPDPVWDAEKAALFAEWASGNFWQFFPTVNFWSKRNHESPGGYLEQTTAQLIQTFLNRPK